MRLMLHCAAGLGHVHPVIPLARAAAEAGDEVLFATPAEGVATIESFGFAATAVPYGDPADIGRAWANLPDHDLNTYVVADIFVRIQGRAALPALRAAIASFGADLVISAELGGLVAAEASDVRSGHLGITALDLDDLDWTRVVAAMDDLRESAGLSRTGRMPYDGRRFLSPIPPMLWADPAKWPADGIWYRHEDAEGPVDPAARRPSRPRPKVYATLGSIAGGNDFGRHTFQPLLDALGRLDADVLFTIGPFDRQSARPACRTTSPWPRTRRRARPWTATWLSCTPARGPPSPLSPAGCRWLRYRCSPTRCTTPTAWSRPGSECGSIPTT